MPLKTHVSISIVFFIFIFRNSFLTAKLHFPKQNILSGPGHNLPSIAACLASQRLFFYKDTKKISYCLF